MVSGEAGGSGSEVSGFVSDDSVSKGVVSPEVVLSGLVSCGSASLGSVSSGVSRALKSETNRKETASSTSSEVTPCIGVNASKDGLIVDDLAFVERGDGVEKGRRNHNQLGAVQRNAGAVRNTDGDLPKGTGGKRLIVAGVCHPGMDWIWCRHR